MAYAKFDDSRCQDAELVHTQSSRRGKEHLHLWLTRPTLHSHLPVQPPWMAFLLVINLHLFSDTYNCTKAWSDQAQEIRSATFIGISSICVE